MSDAPISLIQEQVNKQIWINIEEVKEKQQGLTDRVRKLEEITVKQEHKRETADLAQRYELQELFAKTLREELTPILEQHTEFEKRLREVEDRPMKTTFKIVIWAAGVMGTTILGLLGVLLKTLFTK